MRRLMNREVIKTPLFIKYLKVYESNPRSTVFAPLAEGYRQAGMLEKAMDILKKGVKYHPSYITGYLGLASCYFDLSQYNLTYLTLRPLVGSNRDNIKLQRLFAQTCYKVGQKDEALQTYKYLLFINPRDEESAKWVKQLEDQEQLLENDDFLIEDNTFPLDNLSTYSNNKNIDEWQQIDLAHQETKKVKETKESKKEKRKTTDSNVPTYTLADLYFRQGHFDKAKKILEKLAVLRPQDLNVRRKLEEIKKMTIEKESSLCNSFNEESRKENDSVKLLEKKMGAFFKAIQNKAKKYTQGASPKN
ncbi:MAG: tetratricopeptide repeat protein [Halobacteriovoraceae bacterium]|nr:tetratricopeptide repeat protein [Halobacteriovoraceae bacterium]